MNIKNIGLALVLSIATTFGAMACKTTVNGNAGPVQTVRQKLEQLPEPTFNSLEVYVHDLSAKGVELLLAKYPDAKIPLRAFSDASLSVLENQSATMLDLVTMSNSLDEIKEGKVKAYLDIAWTLLEINGVIRRDDLTATLTVREQRLVIALCKGIRLGTDPSAEREKILNSFGPRY